MSLKDTVISYSKKLLFVYANHLVTKAMFAAANEMVFFFKFLLTLSWRLKKPNAMKSTRMKCTPTKYFQIFPYSAGKKDKGKKFKRFQEATMTISIWVHSTTLN